MSKKKILVWETLASVSGGQKMTISIIDMLSDYYDFAFLIPAEGLLSDSLKARGIPYVLMGDQSLPKGVKGKRVVFKYFFLSVRNIYKSLKVIRKIKPDLLYCPGPAALPWSAICGSVSKKPVIWHLHHVFLDGATKKLLNLCSRWKSVSRIIAVSNCVGAQLFNEDVQRKISVIYNPVDFDRYSNGSSADIKSELENVLGYAFPVSSIVIGHIALVQRSKRQDFVLEVISELKKQGKSVLGFFAGEIREEEYYKELLNKAEKLNISNQIALLGRRNDIPNLLKLCDLIIIPSAFEGFPLAGLEAASAGVPVLACNVAGAEEFVKVSGDGLCFKDSDVSDAVNAVNLCLVNRDSWSELGIIFAKKCSLDEYSKSIHSLFKSVSP